MLNFELILFTHLQWTSILNLETAVNRRKKRMHADKTWNYIKKVSDHIG